MIHTSAIIDPKAQVDPTCKVGPYSIIGPDVVIGPHCELAAQVQILGPTTLGEGNKIHAGCILGGDPQDFKFEGIPTKLVIGDNNVFREFVTIHRSNNLEENTVIGNGNYFMANSHVGHNSHVGDNNILVNGALVAGHVTMDDKCILSGNVLVHQFVRIGSYSMAQGGAGLSKDLPPFCLAAKDNSVSGINLVGMRRNGFDSKIRSEIKSVYRCLLMPSRPMVERLKEAEENFKSPEARQFIQFVKDSSRGVCTHGGH